MTGAVFVFLVLSMTLVAFHATTAFTEWYGRKIAGRADSTIDDQFLALFKKTARVVLFFISITIILEHFGIKITGILATAGVASLAIAFAAQETLSNMISGFVVMIDRPFRVGDRIELANGKAGDVLEVGLRSTRILSFDNTVITIPNAELAKSQIINLSLPNINSKVRATLGIAHDSDIRKAKAIIMEILTEMPDILKSPAPVVLVTEMTEFTVKVYYEGWIADFRIQGRVCDAVLLAVKDQFDAAGIRLSLPRYDVNVVRK